MFHPFCAVWCAYVMKLICGVGMQVTELKPEWLVEIAPHYYQMKDVEDGMKSLLVYLYFCIYALWRS